MIWTMLVAAAAASESPGLTERLQAALPEEGEVLVAASGPEAHHAVVTALAKGELDASRIALVRLPTTGDLDALALQEADEAGITCVIRLSQGLDGVWSTPRLGTCALSAAAQAAAATPPSSGAEPSEGVASEAPAAVTLTPAIWASRERRFNEQRLLVEDTLPGQAPDGVGWQVLDGQGNRLDTQAFATLAGDEEALLGLATERERGEKRVRVLRWTGIAGLILSPVPLIGWEAGASQTNEDRVFTALFLAGISSATLVVAPSARKAVAARQAWPANYYREEDAGDVVTAHNKALFRELQLGDMPEPEPEGAPSQAEPGAAAPDASAPDTPEDLPPVGTQGAPAEQPVGSGPGSDAAPAPAPAPASPPAETPAPPAASDGSDAPTESAGGAPSPE